MVDYKDYINLKIKKLEDRFVGKQFVVFGAGHKTERFMSLWDIRNRVIMYVDNNEKLWGSKLFGKTVQNPKEIKDLNCSNVIIMIISPYIDQIRAQINDMEVDCVVYDAVEILFLDNEIKHHVEYHNKFMQYLHSVDKINNINTSKKPDPPIGIVIDPAFYGSSCYYSIMVLLLLIYRGYKATLIIDDLKGIEEYVIGEGISEISYNLVNQVVRYISTNIVKLDVKYISDSHDQTLTLHEERKVRENSIVNTIWHKSIKTFKCRYRDKEILQEDFQAILLENCKKIKGFLIENSFSVINVYAGIYNDFGLFRILTEQDTDIRFTSYDSEFDRISFCNGTIGQVSEIRQHLENYSNNSAQYKELINIGERELQRQMCDCHKANERSYQLVNEDDYNENIDIFIPLNIDWDSAAVPRWSIFSSMKQWLIETLDYLVKETTQKIMVREHPVTVLFKDDFNFTNYEGILRNRYDPERVIFISATDKINTYKQLKKCKLVLPYTSTVGIEAAALGKSVVLCNDVYYSSAITDKCLHDKIDYFKTIEYALEHPIVYTELQKEKIRLAIALHAYISEKTVFYECTMDWVNYDFTELNHLKVVDHIIQMIAENKSFIYQNYLDNKLS